MKSVFMAGSRKFYKEIENLVKELKKCKVKVDIAGNWDNSKEDSLNSEKKALLSAFRKIDKFDIMYIYSDKGYIGKTVAMEIAYAYSKNKEIISSHKIEELSAQALVSLTLKPKKLISYCSN